MEKESDAVHKFGQGVTMRSKGIESRLEGFLYGSIHLIKGINPVHALEVRELRADWRDFLY
jgi:hypothetical protein